MRTAGLSPFQLDHYGKQLRGFFETLGVMLIILLGVLVLSMLGIARAHAQTQTVTLTSSAPTGVAPHTQTLTWSSLAGSVCTKSGSWTGTTTNAGTQTINDLQASANYRISCTKAASGGTASLSWIPPTQNTDGSSLTNLAGYRVVYGTSATALAQTIQIATPGASTYTVSGLASGTWFFGVKAYTSGGVESAVSNVASKVVTTSPAATGEASVAVTVTPRPNPPTQLQVVEQTVFNVGQFYHAKWMPLRGIRYGTIPLGEPCMQNRPVLDSYYGVDKAKVTWDKGKTPLNYPIAKCQFVASTNTLTVE